ncbi:MAG: GIY-YIG nuclease family protein [Elusimicrobia bacterium]|nr:GIY-YIG nuclease family protein [Elusimicrobiota bacterium]
MYYLYILKSKRNGRYYIGSTGNLGKRLEEHNRGKTKSTKKFVPYQLEYKETFDTLSEARKREYYIKSQKSSRFVEKLIKSGSGAIG